MTRDSTLSTMWNRSSFLLADVERRFEQLVHGEQNSSVGGGEWHTFGRWWFALRVGMRRQKDLTAIAW